MLYDICMDIHGLPFHKNNYLLFFCRFDLYPGCLVLKQHMTHTCYRDRIKSFLCGHAAVSHMKATLRLQGCVRWDYSNPEWCFIGDITHNDNSIPSAATGWPCLPETLEPRSQRTHQNSLETWAAAENRAVAVCICFNQNRNRLAWWGQQHPYCFTRHHPRRAGSGPRSQAAAAAAAAPA